MSKYKNRPPKAIKTLKRVKSNGYWFQLLYRKIITDWSSIKLKQYVKQMIAKTI
ncbi:MAG: hypothetical protein FWG20_07450 [Candidatus Cloacimonetes bacterium]|nr:hypothetical protein [Candidatus Cloacimonadota bacterium]